jgi:hypothetical protein
MNNELATALAHARIARAARARIAEARNANDVAEVERWTRHEAANMRCFRMDLDELTAHRDDASA